MTRTAYTRVLLGLGIALCTLLIAGCAMPTQAARLRLTNRGTTAIKNLTVLFPDEQIGFGDVAAGATTEYKSVPKGVYGYAAYRFDVDGQNVTQPVIDWVGETPMPGSAFTYVIEYNRNPAGAPMQRIQLINVVRDN